MGIDEQRTPLITAAGRQLLTRLREHPAAPKFNYATGDRLQADDLERIARFREALHAERQPYHYGPPPPAMLARVAGWRERVPAFRARIASSIDLERDWTSIPTTSRRDLALAPWDFVPDDLPLDRLIIYRTAGTTGHPISIPHHPFAVRCYEPLIEFALAAHGAHLETRPDRVACFLVGAQIRTYTYAALLYNWNGAGFAKLNIRPTEWRDPEDAQKYFADLAPQFLTGDPISFAEMLKQNLPASPLALVTTSVAMSPTFKVRLSQHYRAPVIDWYSMVETGPIGYADPSGEGYRILPHDIYVEVLRPDDSVCEPGERGEIAVTGGRNPFAPLLRYRTGDFGRLDDRPAPHDPQPRLLDLEGRAPVLLRHHDGTPVSPVDISRLLREFPLLLHEFTQHADLACELVVRPLPDARPDLAEIEQVLRRALGPLPLEIRRDDTLGERGENKVLPYKSELMLED